MSRHETQKSTPANLVQVLDTFHYADVSNYLYSEVDKPLFECNAYITAQGELHANLKVTTEDTYVSNYSGQCPRFLGNLVS